MKDNRPGKQVFLDTWDRANRNDPPPRIRDLFLVNDDDLFRTHRGQRFKEYCGRRGGKWDYGYHGSLRECHVGNRQLGVENGHLVCCDSEECGICGIIRKSFKIGRSKSAGLFGKGIYASECSLKANSFSYNINGQNDLHMILLVKFVPRRVQHMRQPCQFRTAPDPGFDSVEAVLRPAGSVFLPESVVYREDAIVPVGAITYCRGNDTDDRINPSVGLSPGPSRVLSPTRRPSPGPSRPPNPGPSQPTNPVPTRRPNPPSRSPSRSRSWSPHSPPSPLSPHSCSSGSVSRSPSPE
ncbi:uncharacterized protein B0J16DRAFT_376985 [Fusarium flagelliforme]|uniref:uncharacterized protein n=1 Tax=Fusarium flagelliforme TaxID=2675880 RepID=UPI001E8EB0E2|nr:uncharacterized protein B0J16DRAFT_376985 [Fusarium flagelliforme]KAH7196521.1 hypothetical protein B0J16DRAFT_376985 [Fusarium flagelliforme]